LREKIAGRKIAVLSAERMGLMETVGSGAVADGETLEMARAIGLDPADVFRRSDAFTCLRDWTKSSSPDRQEIICATCGF